MTMKPALSLVVLLTAVAAVAPEIDRVSLSASERRGQTEREDGKESEAMIHGATFRAR